MALTEVMGSPQTSPLRGLAPLTAALLLAFDARISKAGHYDRRV
jgi:hypothetical protein